MLSVGLGPCVYLWNAYTSQVRRMIILKRKVVLCDDTRDFNHPASCFNFYCVFSSLLSLSLCLGSVLQPLRTEIF